MLVRRIARPMLAASFISLGIETLRNPAPRVEAAAPLLDQVKGAVPDDKLEQAKNSVGDSVIDDATLVKINAGVQLGGGLLLATGRLPRLASLALAGSLVPTTVAAHAFWDEDSETTKAAQRTQFLKNLGLLGGLLLAAVDTEGKPSVAWRARKSAKLAKAAASQTVGSSSGSDTAESLRSAAQNAAGRSQDLAKKVAESDTTAKLVAGGSGLASAAASRATDLAHTVAESDTTKRLASQGTSLAQTAAKRGSELADEGSRRGRKLAEQARANAQNYAAQAPAKAQELNGDGGRKARKLAKQTQRDAQALAAEMGARGELAAAKAQRKARQNA